MNTQTSKIVRFHQTGSAEVLKIETCPEAEPGAGELRIKVEALGLNRAEIMFREGQYLENPQLPSRLGYEAAGVVTAIGPNIKEFRIGERVSTIPAFSQSKYGVYGESAILPVHAITTYPDNLSPSEGAAIWMQYLTAYGALIDIGKTQAENTVLITAASSSVGLAAIQITKMLGAQAIAVTRGENKKQFLLDAGADHVITTDKQSLADTVMDISQGHGADLIFDPVAGPQLQQLADAAAFNATLIEYGALSPEPTPYPLFTALAKGLTIRGYTLFEITHNPERLRRARDYIYAALAADELKPIIDRAFTLEKIAEAHRYMESNRQTGKIVITI